MPMPNLELVQIFALSGAQVHQLLFCLQVFGSPFEADAQCSHLVRLGLCDVAGTSDSDLLTFGCPLTLYGHYTTSKKLGAMVRPGETCSPAINDMTPQEVVFMTCLCGCDYIDNLQGIGIVKAIEIVKSWRGKPDEVLWPRTPHAHTYMYVMSA